MIDGDTRVTIHQSVIESLTVDAMVLADEVETYFGVDEDGALNGLASPVRARITRAGLRLSARLTRLVDWLVWRDGDGGTPADTHNSADAPDAELACGTLPPRARALFAAARAIFERVDALDDAPSAAVAVMSPARVLQERLARSLAG